VSSDPVALKAALRRRLLATRRAIPAGQAAAAALAARDYALADLRPPPGAVIGGYWPIRGELDPRPLLAALRDLGHIVALPVTPPPEAPPRLSFRAWDGDPASLEAGPLNTRHPAPPAEVVTPSWLVVPLAGFDRRGVRLGYGGGYYDRLLAETGGNVMAVGLAFAVQEVPMADGGLPNEPHDIPLSAVVTDAGLIHPTRAKAPSR